MRYFHFGIIAFAMSFTLNNIEARFILVKLKGTEDGLAGPSGKRLQASDPLNHIMSIVGDLLSKYNVKTNGDTFPDPSSREPIKFQRASGCPVDPKCTKTGDCPNGCDCTKNSDCESNNCANFILKCQKDPCFHGSNKVQLENGREKKISEVKVGDSVLAVDQHGLLRFSPVIMQLHQSPEERSIFLVIRTKTGRNLTLTPNHLMYKKMNGKVDLNLKEFFNFHTVFAKDVRKDDKVLVLDGRNGMKSDRVVSVEVVSLNGVYSPLTAHGNIIVEDILASCYSDYQSHSLLQIAFAPFRWFHDAKLFFQKTKMAQKEGKSTMEQDNIGRHWYATALIEMGKILIPEKMA